MLQRVRSDLYVTGVTYSNLHRNVTTAKERILDLPEVWAKKSRVEISRKVWALTCKKSFCRSNKSRSAWDASPWKEHKIYIFDADASL